MSLIPLALGSSLRASANVLSRRVIEPKIDISHLKNIVPENHEIHIPDNLPGPLPIRKTGAKDDNYYAADGRPLLAGEMGDYHPDRKKHSELIHRLNAKQEAYKPHAEAYRVKQQAVLNVELPKLRAEGVKPGDERMGRLVKALGPQLMAEREALIRAHEQKIFPDSLAVKFLPYSKTNIDAHYKNVGYYKPHDNELKGDKYRPGESIAGRRASNNKNKYLAGTPFENEPEHY